jgi:hypothetical protein
MVSTPLCWNTFSRISCNFNGPVHSLHLLQQQLVCTTTHCSLKAYCAILVRRSNFRYQASPRVSPRESTQRRKVELWARKCPVILPKWRLPRHFRNLLHAVKLRHGTDGLIPLRRKACWVFFRPKNPTTSAGCKRANLGTKGQHATSRPPKPLYSSNLANYCSA